MESETIFGSCSLPISDPKLAFADVNALATFLNEREKRHFEIIKAIGFYKDPGTQLPAGNFYEYKPIEILEESGPAQSLSVFEVEVGRSWNDFIADKVDRFELQDRANILLNGQVKEVALMRALERPNTFGQTQLGTTATGWDWLTPQIVNGDLVVQSARCTWFGGPHDHEDTGETASGRVNTRQQPDFRGCALPMNGFRMSKRTMGSPIPRFRWLTPVEVECIEPDLKGRKITVELIDLGPARETKTAIDLTERAFNSLGAASSRGVLQVNFRIPNWKQHLEPGATFTEIPASSSEQKPIDLNGDKVRAGLSLPPSFNVAAFETFMESLRLRFFTAEELMPYFTNVRNGVRNQPPDPLLWQNFVPTLLVLDKLRANLDAALYVTSSYRHPDYNRQLDGAAVLSQHMAFRAADIQVAGITPSQVHQALRDLRGTRLSIPAGAQFSAAGMINSGNGIDPNTPFVLGGLQFQSPTVVSDGHFLFEGGLGLYQTFVHVDCRGIRANW